MLTHQRFASCRRLVVLLPYRCATRSITAMSCPVCSGAPMIAAAHVAVTRADVVGGASSQTRSPPDTPKGLNPKVAKTPLETSHVRVSIDEMTSYRPSKRTDAQNDNNISPPVLVRTSGLAFLREIPCSTNVVETDVSHAAKNARIVAPLVRSPVSSPFPTSPFASSRSPLVTPTRRSRG